MGLFEVQDAVESLRYKTGNQTDIVLGVINDDDMGRRVQVILMITGLGESPVVDSYTAEEISKGNGHPSPTSPMEKNYPGPSMPNSTFGGFPTWIRD